MGVLALASLIFRFAMYVLLSQEIMDKEMTFKLSSVL